MNCAKHPENQATAFCRACGKAVCDACQTKAHGTVFCEEHKPMTESANAGFPAGPSPIPSPVSNYDPIYGRPEYPSPYTAPPQQVQTPPPPPGSISPGLAFLLGWIPGVGAIYNGQYAKGLMHVVVFGLLVSIINAQHNSFLEPLLGMLIGCMVFYMPFEAYHTAKRRMQGLVVDEFSSLIRINPHTSAFPAAPMVLIGLGVLFLLSNFDLIQIDTLLRFWPIGMIGLGAYLLMVRMRNQRRLP
jgi:hypothetical protein